MTFIKYDEAKPFNTELVEFESEQQAFINGYIRAGEFEVNLINDNQALWWKRSLRLTRDVRQDLLKAFDTYSKNVAYGIENETAEQHLNVISWRQSLLDLKRDAFVNIPDRIKYYLEKE